MKAEQSTVPSVLVAAAVTALLFATPHSMAAAPDLTAGGTPDNSRTMNLGPTGMRGWVYHVNGGGRRADTGESRQILVTAVDGGSPAHGVLAADDVILGANGTGANPRPFSSDARKSLALAIADAEARDPATLNLLRWRSGTTTTVRITLRAMGAYSSSAPYDCPKSSRILTEGARWVFNHESSGRYSFGALSLLATGDSAYAARVRGEARARVPNATTRRQMMSDTRDATSMVTWERGHTLVFLAEYYLATGDAQVLPGIEAYAVNIAKNSSIFGTVGHIFADKNPDGTANGPMGGVYGPVNSSGMPCFLGLLLARECGLTHPAIQPAIDRASLFFASYTGRGAIPYGEHQPSYSHEGNGRSGLAALCFALQDQRVEAGKFFAKMATAAPSEREHGHTGAFFNYLWAPLGAAAGGEAAAAEHFKRISWHLDLARRWDGSFVYDCLNGEGPNSGSTYHDFRMSTAALLVYALPLRQLHMTGRDHDPDRRLTRADVADAANGDDYDPDDRTTAQLISDTGSWSPKLRRRAAIELNVRGVSASQREQLQAIAADRERPAHVRAGACDALGRIANSASAPVLAGLLNDSENHVRYAAAEALRYLPNTARRAVLEEVLVATAETAKPWFPIDEEDPLQFAHGRLAVLLFYGGNAYGPKGIIWNNLSGVDRDLLYPAIRAVAGSPLGFTRNNLQWTYPMLTRAETLAVSGAVVDSVREFAPSDRMFAFSVRQTGFDLMEKFDIAEGVPAGMKYVVETKAGDRTTALRTLERYAASYTTVNPVPDVIGAVTPYLNATDGNAAQRESVRMAARDVLDAIAADTRPRTLVPLKEIRSVVADDPELVLPASSTVLRATFHDHAQGDSVFTWTRLSGPGVVNFSPNGTVTAATSTVQFEGTAGTYEFEVTMSDSRGLTEATSTVSVELHEEESGFTPPNPNPATFAVAPAAISDTAIRMTATTGSDPSGPVEYLFTETSGNPGGASSGWQTSPDYTDTGLRSETTYGYTVTMRDGLGHTGSPSAEAGATTPGELVAPTLASIEDNVSGGPVRASTGLIYTVAFDTGIDPATIDPEDFGNGGSAAITVDRVTPTADPAVFEVGVSLTGAGDLRFEIVAGATITGIFGTPLDASAALADDTTITVDASPEPPRGQIEVDGTASWSNQSTGVFSGTFDASGSDKLVVILTGEHGFNNDAGTVNSVTYDGRPLTPVIQRDARTEDIDTVYNHMWILDDPATSTGEIAVDVVNRGNVTVFGLSGTLPGAGAAAISANNTRTVDLATTAPNSLVIASFGMGGGGNTANVGAVTVDSPLIFASARHNGGDRHWDGHVTGYAEVPTAAIGTYSFTGGDVSGAYVIAAEFPAEEASGGPPFDDWAAGFGGLTDSGLALDFDRGGLDTGIEWVVGGDPTDPNDDAGLAPTLDHGSDPDFFIFSYRRTDAAAADANTDIAVEYGSDLVGWTDAVAGADVEIDVIDDGAGVGIDLVRVKMRRSLTGDGRFFVRLNAAITSP